MNRNIGIAAALFVCCLGGAVAANGATGTIKIHDGQWETVTTLQGEKPQASTDCVVKGKDDVINENVEPNDKCKEKRTVTGNKFSMTQVCEDPDMGTKSEVQMEMTYSSSESCKGTLLTTITDKSGKTTVQKGTISGRRIGACTETPKE